jgi:uncharacterized protein (DUF4415 family)
MTTSGVLSAERIAEIRAFKNQPDPECPPLAPGEIEQGHFRNPEAAQKAIAEMRRQKQAEQSQAVSTAAPVSVNLDADVSEWVAQRGADYSAIINQILREVIRLNRITAAV